MAEDLPDDLNLLVALEVLLAERHVTRAARRLGVTQSAMSQRLTRLREFFADGLLVAGRPDMALTPRGEALKEPLAHALSSLRAALSAGAPFDRARTERTFHLLGNDYVEAAGLPPLLARIRAQAPLVTLIVERIGADFWERLEKGSADLAFVPDFLLPGSARRWSLPPESFVVLLREGHPAAQQPLTLERYLELDHLLVAPRGAPGSLVDSQLAARGLSRRVAARVAHFVSAPFIVADTELALTCTSRLAGLGTARLPVCERPLPLELPADRASMIWHERSQSDAAHQWLREQIQDIIKVG